MEGAKRAVTEEAIARIREMIIGGQLGPGDRLPREGDLAAALGLGWSSLREAVRDHDFHSCIVEAVGNPFLKSLHENLARGTIQARIWRTDVDAAATGALTTEHRDIYAAIEARDPALARTASTRHLVSSESGLRRALASRTGGVGAAHARN
jgi:DNA-binding FadR family transcriptional regulator